MSQEIAIDSPGRFINRELSWLEFNDRVLEEACIATVPLLERVKFLSICTSNLDEFFMVRVAGHKREVAAGIADRTSDGLTPQEQLRAIALRTRQLLRRQYACFNLQVRPELEKQGIRILRRSQLPDYREYLRAWYESSLFPLLTPLAIDATHPFPVLANRGLYLAVGVKEPVRGFTPGTDLILIQVPSNLPRYLRLPVAAGSKEIRFAAIEDIARLFLEDLLRGYRVSYSHAFRVTRDSDLTVEEEVPNLPEAIRLKLRQRLRGDAVRLEVERDMPPELSTRLRRNLRLRSEDLYRLPEPLDLSALGEIPSLPGFDRLRDKPMPGSKVVPHPLLDERWFSVIRRQDVLLLHPFHSFDPVVELLEQAAEDPKVLAIKQTLYRAAQNSRVIQALLRAAEKGKQVTVLMEIKARFDEERNLAWSRKLEEAGAHVVYGVAGLKTHCKALLIVRREEQGSRSYVHLSTGNYNERTAHQYTDIGLLTANPEIGEDVASLFNVLTGYFHPPSWKHIRMAPTDLKDHLLGLIRREAELSRRGGAGRIVAKVNSIVDEEVIDALYEASRSGVSIDLIVRGVCRLRPQVPGLSENIRVLSIIDRFLEHSRVFYFGNSGTPEVYLASCDWMRRNFHSRVEIVFPVLDTANRRSIERLLDLCLRDEAKAWMLRPDGSYRREGKGSMRSQIASYEAVRSGELFLPDEEVERKAAALESNGTKPANRPRRSLLIT